MAKQTYELVGWKNESEGDTPVSSTNLSHMDEAIKYLYDEGATSKDIFICKGEETKENAPEEAKIVIESNKMIKNGASNVVNNMDGNETDKSPSVDATKKYIKNVQYLSGNKESETLVPSFDCYAEITYQISGWGYGGEKVEIEITCTSGEAKKIAGFKGATRGHDTLPDSMTSMAVFELEKNNSYTFKFPFTSGGNISEGRGYLIKLVPRYKED